MTFVDSSCLWRFLDSLNYTLFDGKNAKKVHRAKCEQGRTPHQTPSSRLLWMPSSKSGLQASLHFIWSSQGHLGCYLLSLFLCGQHLLPRGFPPTTGVPTGLLKMPPWTETRKKKNDSSTNINRNSTISWVQEENPKHRKFSSGEGSYLFGLANKFLWMIFSSLSAQFCLQAGQNISRAHGVV